MSARTVENVACTVCGCVCDDLRLTIAEVHSLEEPYTPHGPSWY